MQTSYLSGIFATITRFLLPRGKWALLVAVLLIGAAVFRFFAVQLDMSISSLLPDSAPELARAGKLLEISPLSRVLLVELSSPVQGHSEAMLRIAETVHRELADFAEATEAVDLPDPEAILSLVPFWFDENLERGIRSASSPQAVESSLRGLRETLSGPYGFIPKEYLRADPLGYFGVLKERFSGVFALGGGSMQDGRSIRLAEDGRHLLFLLKPKSGMRNADSALELVKALMGILERETAAAPGDLSFIVAGGMRYTAENALAIEHDLKLTVPLSLFLIALVYIFLIRSPAAVWLLLVPVAAVVLSASILSLAWAGISGLALGFGAAVLGMTVDYAVLVQFGLRRNQGHRAEAVGEMARPLIFSAALSMSGFCVLLFSGIPAMRQLGLFAVLALFAGLLLAVLVLPCCPWSSIPAILDSGKSGNARSKLRPRFFLAAILAMILLALCAAGVLRIPFEPAVQNLGANNRVLQRQMGALLERWQDGPEPFIWASSASTQDEAALKSFELAEILRSRDGDAKVFSFADIVPPAETQSENLHRWERFVREEGRNIIRNLSLHSPKYGFTEKAFAAFEKRLLARPQGELRQLLEQAGLGEALWWLSVDRDALCHVLTFSNVNFPLQELPETLQSCSTLLSASELSLGLTAAFALEQRLLPVACLICLALLFLCFRRPSMVLLAILPPLFGLAAVAGWLVLSGNTLSIAGGAALLLVIGLGANYGIVMLHEFGSSLVFGAFRAILVSGLTTLAGFGVLLLAEHPVLRELGRVTFFGLSAGLVAVLILIPFLCRREKV